MLVHVVKAQLCVLLATCTDWVFKAIDHWLVVGINLEKLRARLEAQLCRQTAICDAVLYQVDDRSLLSVGCC